LVYVSRVITRVARSGRAVLDGNRRGVGCLGDFPAELIVNLRGKIMGNIKKRQRREKEQETPQERLTFRIKSWIFTIEVDGVGRLPAVLSVVFAPAIYFGTCNLWHAFCAVTGLA
jgi:hypothetical protein